MVIFNNCLLFYKTPFHVREDGSPTSADRLQPNAKYFVTIYGNLFFL